MFKILKKNSKIILIFTIIILVVLISMRYFYDTNKDNNEDNNENNYIINNSNLEIYDNGKLSSTIPIDILKPRIKTRAKSISNNYKNFEHQLNSKNDYWLDLILKEYNIEKSLSNREKYCKLRKLTNNCTKKMDECPKECNN